MKTFAFVSNNWLKSAYTSILLRYKKQDALLDMVKIVVLVSVFLISAGFYLRYVSLASTRWYFLRQENQKLNSVSFQYEILKTQLLEQKLSNRSVLDGNLKEREMVVLPIDVVNTSGKQETTFLDRL